ncbi:MAG: dihydrolipoyl dehydrogenase [Gemmatimonadota bacterium]
MAEVPYDLIVIGAGPGGYIAAARAAELGMRVACVDRRWLGGTCLNVGCIPSKALLESSERYRDLARGLQHHGIRVGEVGFDLPAMMARKEKIVQAMVQGIAGLFKKHRVDYLVGTAAVPAPGQVRVTGAAGEQHLRAPRVLLAMGSVPAALPGLPFDGQRIISSTEALSLDRVPERLLVIGAGAIGLELGSVWSRLGAEVLVVEYLDAVLPGADREISSQLERLLKRQGMAIQLSASAAGARFDGDRVAVTIEPRGGGEARTEECDCVLVAVGRRPASTGLESLGVALDHRGCVQVDENYQTSIPGVYAIGDLVPGPMLAHRAEAEGTLAVERMAGRGGRLNYEAVPAIVYTHPEVASVGRTEEQLAAEGRAVRVGRHLFRANARAHCMDEIDGLVKVIADAQTDRVLGVHILGPQASHLIAEGVLAMEMAASAEDLARTIHGHPTLSEVVKEAAWATQA